MQGISVTNADSNDNIFFPVPFFFVSSQYTYRNFFSDPIVSFRDFLYFFLFIRKEGSENCNRRTRPSKNIIFAMICSAAFFVLLFFSLVFLQNTKFFPLFFRNKRFVLKCSSEMLQNFLLFICCKCKVVRNEKGKTLLGVCCKLTKFAAFHWNISLRTNLLFLKNRSKKTQNQISCFLYLH